MASARPEQVTSPKTDPPPSAAPKRKLASRCRIVLALAPRRSETSDRPVLVVFIQCFSSAARFFQPLAENFETRLDQRGSSSEPRLPAGYVFDGEVVALDDGGRPVCRAARSRKPGNRQV